MDEKITLDIHYNRSSGSFDCLMKTEIDESEHIDKIGGTNAQALLKKIVMLLNASLEDLAGEDDYED